MLSICDVIVSQKYVQWRMKVSAPQLIVNGMLPNFSESGPDLRFVD